MSSSLVRRSRIASSSSRAIASGHHDAPAREDRTEAFGGERLRRRDGERGATRAPVDAHVDVLVRVAGVVDGARERRERDARRVARPVARGGERDGALLHRLRELLRLRMAVDEPPLLRALRAHAFDQRAEDVGVVAPDAALVGEAREPAGAGQHARAAAPREGSRPPTGRRRGGSRRRRAPTRSRRRRSCRCTRRRT